MMATVYGPFPRRQSNVYQMKLQKQHLLLSLSELVGPGIDLATCPMLNQLSQSACGLPLSGYKAKCITCRMYRKGTLFKCLVFSSAGALIRDTVTQINN